MPRTSCQANGVFSQTDVRTPAVTSSAQESREVFTGPMSLTPCRYSVNAIAVPTANQEDPQHRLRIQCDFLGPNPGQKAQDDAAQRHPPPRNDRASVDAKQSLRQGVIHHHHHSANQPPKQRLGREDQRVNVPMGRQKEHPQERQQKRCDLPAGRQASRHKADIE